MVKPLAVFIFRFGRHLFARRPHFHSPRRRFHQILHHSAITPNSKPVSSFSYVCELENLGEHAEVWEKVVKKLRTADPCRRPRMPRPDEATYNSTAAWLETASRPGVRPKHVEPGKLPLAAPAEPDRIRKRHSRSAGAGRATQRDGLFARSCHPITPAAGSTTSPTCCLFHPPPWKAIWKRPERSAVWPLAILAMPVMVNTYRLSGEHTQDIHVQGLPFGTRGGLGVRTDVPLDGDYVFKIELARLRANPINWRSQWMARRRSWWRLARIHNRAAFPRFSRARRSPSRFMCR